MQHIDTLNELANNIIEYIDKYSNDANAIKEYIQALKSVEFVTNGVHPLILQQFTNHANFDDFIQMLNERCCISDYDISKWNVVNTDCETINSSIPYEYEIPDYLNLTAWNVSKYVDMSCMFRGWEFEHVNVSNWNTSSVTNMSCMFENSNAVDLDLSTWDVSNVVDMHGMFKHARITSTLNLSTWDVSNVVDMHGMFEGL